MQIENPIDDALKIDGEPIVAVTSRNDVPACMEARTGAWCQLETDDENAGDEFDEEDFDDDFDDDFEEEEDDGYGDNFDGVDDPFETGDDDADKDDDFED